MNHFWNNSRMDEHGLRPPVYLLQSLRENSRNPRITIPEEISSIRPDIGWWCNVCTVCHVCLHLKLCGVTAFLLWPSYLLQAMFFSSSHAAFAYTRLISNRGLQWRHGELTLVGKHVSLFLWLLLSTAVVIHYRRLWKLVLPRSWHGPSKDCHRV